MAAKDSFEATSTGPTQMLWAVVAYLGIVALAWLWSGATGVVQTVVIALTGVAVFWTAIETVKLRRAAHDQIEAQLLANELSNRPLILLRTDTTRDVIRLENIGRGPALNARMDQAELYMGQEDCEPVQLKFGSMPAVILEGGIVDVQVEAELFGASIGDFFNYALNPEYASHPITVTVRYEDLQLNSYRVCQTIEPGSLRTTAIDVKRK
jgi:hypothetical protein